MKHIQNLIFIFHQSKTCNGLIRCLKELVILAILLHHNEIDTRAGNGYTMYCLLILLVDTTCLILLLSVLLLRSLHGPTGWRRHHVRATDVARGETESPGGANRISIRVARHRGGSHRCFCGSTLVA